MSVTEAIVDGMLKPDGALELDQKPNLPPGRVTAVRTMQRWRTTSKMALKCFVLCF